MSKWLRKNGVFNVQASEWNELTQILRELFLGKNSSRHKGFEGQYSLSENLRADLVSINEMRSPYFVMVVDIALLDLSTEIWKEQLNFLDKYSGKAKFAWVLNHDTSNAVKMELRRRGHVSMVNKPLYKAKMVQLLEAVIKERSLETQKRSHECLEIDPTQFETGSSDESDVPEPGSSNKNANPFQIETKYQAVKNCLVELTHVHPNDERGGLGKKEQENRTAQTQQQQQQHQGNSLSAHKSLQGLRILIAEDTPVLQRVATIMLEKMGASVTAVGDGLQAVEILNAEQSCSSDGSTKLFDLILMDCQVSNSDFFHKLLRL